MLVWIVFGVLAFGLASGIDALAGRSAWLTSHWHYIAAGLILMAGVYQFTPWKNVCLRRCRTPMGFLLQHWKDGWLGAFVMGFKHGLYCAGCCWLLFVILVPLGVMNLVAMGIVTVIVFAEKTLPGGDRIARLAGAALIVFGTMALFRPGSLPGGM
jgi:predicted metal-binding membrane protein